MDFSPFFSAPPQGYHFIGGAHPLTTSAYGEDGKIAGSQTVTAVSAIFLEMEDCRVAHQSSKCARVL
jgi:hypothetical protein